MTTSIKYKAGSATLFLGKLKKNIGIIEKRGKDYTALLSAITFRDIITHFEGEQGPGNQRWQKWSDAYVNILSRRKGPVPENILQDTGKLRQGVQIGNTRKAKNRPNPAGIEFYNPAKTPDGFPYAQAHNEGGNSLPKREFMWLSDKAMEDMAKQTLKFLGK